CAAPCAVFFCCPIFLLVAAPRAELCFRAGWFSGSCAARRFVLRRAQACAAPRAGFVG
ncbi:hypothetical protein A2U01_0066957, partial [Trifolium medium]|nr:hypothetical protein [Trifolium medium]